MVKAQWFFIIILMILSWSPQAEELLSREAGNGGDVVECDPDGDGVFRYHTLDSVMVERASFFKIKEYESTESALNSILWAFDNKLPVSMSVKLRDFLETYKKKRNKKRDVFWHPQPPKPIADEGLFAVVPEYCRPEEIQAVVRVEYAILSYYYDPYILDELEKNGDELSWMLIHEFLRDFTQNPELIRVVNAYIHSEEFLEDSRSRANDQFKIIGAGVKDEDLNFVTMQREYEEMDRVRGYIKELAELKKTWSQVKKTPQQSRSLSWEVIFDLERFAESWSVTRYTDEFDSFFEDVENLQKEVERVYSIR